MQTRLNKQFLDTAAGKRADSILRSCVHCGFCTATCPTYQLLGDELDSPRGRIYLIKQMLEGQTVSQETLSHLDRCLTCRACETTCPSGVEYVQLLEIGKHEASKRIRRPVKQRLLRKLLLTFLPDSKRFAYLIKLASFFKPVLPKNIKKQLPVSQTVKQPTLPEQKRKMLILEGCVQPALAPEINLVSRQVLNRLGIELVSLSGCCGAIRQHLGDEDNAQQEIKNNIDRILAAFADGIEGFLITATGCAAMVKDYPQLLQDDPVYHEKAKTIAEKSFDLSEVIDTQILKQCLKPIDTGTRVAIHTPCTLQHAMKLPDNIEQILSECGYTLTATKEKYLCCGSAGTYSLTQPRISQQLKSRKLHALAIDEPNLIVTGNIGCLKHLGSESQVPVKHWIEVIAEQLEDEKTY